MAYSANKTTLSYKVHNSGTFTQIPMLKEVPEFGGTPEKIDVTTLSDRTKRHIPGIKDYGDLVFKFLYDNSAGGNYRMLKKMATSRTTATFKLEYPDGTAHEFRAIPSVKMDAGMVNGALTFSATMMLQGDVGVTDGTGAPGGSEAVLPEGLLRSRLLTPNDYTFTPQGHLVLTSKTGRLALDNASDDLIYSPFQLRSPQYGMSVWGRREGMDEDHPVVTAEFSHQLSYYNTWREEIVGIPTDATDIQNIIFNIREINMGVGYEAEARSINVEPFTAESGFETFRIYGDFEIDFSESGGDLVTVAYSIIIGARPDRSGNKAAILFEECCCLPASSGVRFEITSGTGSLHVMSFGIQAASAATNTFVSTLQHALEFNEPLQPGDTVNLIADITTKKTDTEQERSVTITQPIERPMMLQGRLIRDESSIFVEEQHDGWSGSARAHGFRTTELFKNKIVINTGLWQWGTDSDLPYSQMFGETDTVTQTLDIHRLEVISRT